jgi:integrase
MMLAGGVDPRTTATRLGHAQPAITMRTYGHMIGSADERAAGVLGALLSAPVNAKSPPQP